MFWKKRFKKNLIVEKLIDQELRQKIEITSQDIIDFYKTYHKETALKEKDGVLTEKKTEDELIASLKRQKTQDKYDGWMQTLKNENPVELNKEKLKTLLLDIEKSEASKNE
jgi:hypothetical protein